VIGLRVAGLVVSLAGLATAIWATARDRRRALYLAPAGIYLSHLAIFYCVRLLQCPFRAETINAWSLTIHIQAALTMIGLELLRGT